MFKKTNLTNNDKYSHTILIFDSGFGGLSIYKKIKLMIPNINYIYVFDNEKFPYGDKNEKFITKRSFEIISAIIKKTIISIVIIACNTITVTSLMTLRNYFNFPIIGIIPNFKDAIQITKNKTIALIGTKITINNCYIKNLILLLSPTYTVQTLFTQELVNIVEQKLKNKFKLFTKIKQILLPLLTQSNIPDTIILGCTHFNFIKSEIQKTFNNNINIIDSKIIIPNYIIKKLQQQPVKCNYVNIAFILTLKNNFTLLKEVLQQYNFTKVKKLTL